MIVVPSPPQAAPEMQRQWLDAMRTIIACQEAIRRLDAHEQSLRMGRCESTAGKAPCNRGARYGGFCYQHRDEGRD